ncbi:FCD domain-containing protein [Polymorphum gilvum]|uniref:FCD domain-containing protein n=1 Tax=Polymorphum gilvum TaxID=991904 RepID=UPI0003006E83|nr:FCD domain-containing protein [Polymorphum gilvum]
MRKDDAGRWVAPALTPDHIGELYELRWLLEPPALVKACANLPAGFLAGMRADLEAAMAEAAPDAGGVLDRLEHQMHVELLAHCRNETLMQAITLHQSLLIAHRFLYRWTPRLFATEPFLAEHLVIVALLEGGRVRDAADALELHLRDSRERAIARVELIRQEYRVEDTAYLTRGP